MGIPCTNGKCECPAGTTVCNGSCVDTTSDGSNCGAFGKQCAVGQSNYGRKRVLPGDPGASYIVDKMTNVDICFGTKMPKLGNISSAQIQSVVDWICQGAPNN